MEILQQKNYNQLDDEIKKLLIGLKYDGNPINIIGSFSLGSQKYPSDIDLMTTIKKEPVKIMFNKFNQIVKYISLNPNLYFIEMKIQDGDKKKRFYPNDKFTFTEFKKYIKNAEFLKIDFVIYLDFVFFEGSIIYMIEDPSKNNKDEEETNKIDDIKKEIQEYKTENNYFKVLKRLFSIFKITKNTDKLIELTNIFNSDRLGRPSQVISNIETINRMGYYDDPITQKRIENNLKQIDAQNPKMTLTKLKKKLQSDSKAIYNQLSE